MNQSRLTFAQEINIPDSQENGPGFVESILRTILLRETGFIEDLTDQHNNRLRENSTAVNGNPTNGWGSFFQTSQTTNETNNTNSINRDVRENNTTNQTNNSSNSNNESQRNNEEDNN